MPLTQEEIAGRLKALEDRSAKLERSLREGRGFTANPLVLATDLDDLGSVKTSLEFEEPTLTPEVPPEGVSRLYAPQGGGFLPTILDQVTLSASAQTLAAFTNIPTGFRNLRLVWNGISDTNADIARNIGLQFNADGGANYHYHVWIDGVSASALSQTIVPVGVIDGATLSQPTWGHVDILNYVNTPLRRSVVLEGGYWQAGGPGLHTFNGIGSWLDVANAINRVDIFSTNAATKFDTGSTAYLYGY